jgi:hypothetical protein
MECVQFFSYILSRLWREYPKELSGIHNSFIMLIQLVTQAPGLHSAVDSRWTFPRFFSRFLQSQFRHVTPFMQRCVKYLDILQERLHAPL